MKTYISKEDADKLLEHCATQEMFHKAVNLAIAKVIGEPVGYSNEVFLNSIQITGGAATFMPTEQTKHHDTPLYAIKAVGNEFPCETFAPERNTK